MVYKLSRNNSITALALLCKVFVGASIVIFASFISAPAIFGQYAKLVSTLLVLAAVFDFGVSLRTLAVSRDDYEELGAIYGFVIFRDLGLLVLSLFLLVFSNFSYSVFFAAILGGHIVSVQSHARAVGNYHFELIINVMMAASTALVFVILYLSKWTGAASVLVFYLVTLPRLVGVVACAWYFCRQRLRAKKNPMLLRIRFLHFFGRCKSLMPYAAQGILVASATNVDVLIASYVMPVADAGRIKLITTVVGLLLMAPEILANIWLNKLANQEDLRFGIARIRKMFTYLGGALFVFGFPLFFFLIFNKINALGYYPLLGALVLSLVVLVRIESLSWATVFTVIKLQKLRLYILVASSCAYWIGVFLLGNKFEISGFLAALFIMSILQLALYYSYGRRRISKLGF